ncbi:MAG: hypothetical protein AB1578_11185 [Thermodesulfobacteriota bacterium]
MRNTRFRRAPMILLAAFLPLALAACGGGGGGGPDTATLSGTVLRDAAPKVAAPDASRTAARVAADLPLAVVAVEAPGNVVRASQALGTESAVTLAGLIEGRDYLIQIRLTDAAGPVLAVLEIAGRVTFNVPAGTGALSLGDIDIDLTTGRASASAAGLAAALPAAAGVPAAFADADADGIADAAALADSDADGIPDGWVIHYFGLVPDPAFDPDADVNGNGLTNLQEFQAGNDPLNPDTDGDGMPNTFEVANGLDPLDPADALVDLNGNGLTNLQEFLAGNDPRNPDTDGDGLPNVWEVEFGLDPLDPADALADANGDGISNLDDFLAGNDPTNPDTDGDGIPNLWEVEFGLDPLDPADALVDLNGNGLTNLQEFQAGNDPRNPDTDGDGMPNTFEVANGLDPLDPADALVDLNGNGLTNLEEFLAGNDPRNPDTDGDGMPNTFEVANGLDPLDPSDAGVDLNSNGLTNLQEFLAGNDPRDPDTDKDGVLNVNDAFPLQFVAWADTDGDGRPDFFNPAATTEQIAASGLVLDPDADGDGVTNDADSFPLDNTRFAEFTPGTLTPAESTFSAAVAINGAGEIVGFSDDPVAQTVHATRWQLGSTGRQLLGALAVGASSAAYDTNGFGRIAGESGDGLGGFFAVVWNDATAAAVLLPGLALDAWSAGYGINDADVVVGEAEDAGGVDRAVAWKWDAGTTTGSEAVELGCLTVEGPCSAFYVADGGLVVGESMGADGFVHAVAWKVDVNGAKTAGPVDLGLVALGTGSAAYGVNDAGLVAGEVTDGEGTLRPATWTVDPETAVMTAGPTLLGDTPGAAWAVSHSGRLAGVATGALALGEDASVVWDDNFTDPTFLEPVQASGISRAYGLNLDGAVVGTFLDEGGASQAFVATQVQGSVGP